MGFKQIIVNRYEDIKEQGQFDVLAGKASRFYQNTSDNVILLGNVRFGLHALDAVLLTRSSIVVLEFKNYEGTIRVSENIWEKLDSNGRVEVEVKGGSANKTPREQAEINQRGIIYSCEEILCRSLTGQNTIKSQVFPVAVIFNRPVTISLASSSAQPAWLKITQNDNFISLLDSLRKNPPVFSNEDIEKLAFSIGARVSQTISNPRMEEAKKMFASKSYNICLNFMDENRLRGFKEADYIRAVCLCELKKAGALKALTNVRLEYNHSETYYYEALILYKGICGSAKDITEAKRLAEEGMLAGNELATGLYNEIRYEEEKSQAIEENSEIRFASLNILAYLSLPLAIAVTFLLFNIPLNATINGILGLSLIALVVLPTSLAQKEWVYTNAKKWIPIDLRLCPMNYKTLTFVKQDDIEHKVLFYGFSLILQILPYICVAVLLYLLKDMEWIKGINYKFFPLYNFCKILFWSYLFYAVASIIIIAERYISFLFDGESSVFTLNGYYRWEIKPDMRLLIESYFVASEFIVTATALSVITTIITIFI